MMRVNVLSVESFSVRELHERVLRTVHGGRLEHYPVGWELAKVGLTLFCFVFFLGG